MPRVSQDEKAKSRQRILEAAARLIRERGVEAAGVADIMAAAGMTVGGFYKHFDSKEALVTAAFKHAADNVLGNFTSSADETRKLSAAQEYIDLYLSDYHINELGRGCPLASNGTDAIRHNHQLRSEAQKALIRTASLLGSDVDSDMQSRYETGLMKLSMMVGAVTLARILNDSADQKVLLDAAKEALVLLEPSTESAS